MLGCVYGGLGIVQAVQNTLNKVWGVPRDSHPNPVRARLRSLLLLAFGGASVIATTVLSALGAAADAYGASLGGSVRALATGAAVRAGQLWPRSLLAPFTDNADLTPRRPACLRLLRQDRTA
jgi:hypothetical protein